MAIFASKCASIEVPWPKTVVLEGAGTGEAADGWKKTIKKHFERRREMSGGMARGYLTPDLKKEMKTLGTDDPAVCRAL